MERFTGYEYLLIDIANHFGLDKKLFHERIEWAEAHLDDLEQFTQDADKPDLYHKAVLALRKVQQGKPTGHLVGFDAVCSGMQVMSAVTGCTNGCEATGLINPNERADAYTKTTDTMSNVLGSQVVMDRAAVKDATMTSFYGSKRVPKNNFGEDSPELDAFYEAINTVAPGAYQLLLDLLASWRPFAKVHEWTLPDGYDARVKVMSKVDNVKIEVDELDHHTFAYEYYVNEGLETGKANAANVTHSLDAYVLRNLVRRCSYDPEMVKQAVSDLTSELLARELNSPDPVNKPISSRALARYYDLYHKTGIADIVALPYLDRDDLRKLDSAYLERLHGEASHMLTYKPFSLVTVHDDFKCHVNYMNYLREQYIRVFMELADSTVIDHILSQLYDEPVTVTKQDPNLSQKIAQSNYALS